MAVELVISQRVSAESARAYAAFTSADELASWWWPHIPDTTYAVDGRVGGGYDIRSAAAGIGARGDFLELDEPESGDGADLREGWHEVLDRLATTLGSDDA